MFAVTLVSIALSVHVAAVVVAFGFLFASPVLVAAVARSDVASLAAVHRAQAAVAKRVISPALAVTLVTGLYLAGREDVFSQWWVRLPLLALLVLGPFNAVVLVRRNQLLADLAPDHGAPDRSHAYRRASSATLALQGIAALIVLATIFVMVVKPST